MEKSELRIQPSARASSVEEYYFARKLREVRAMQTNGIEVINLGIGSPDLPPPGQVVEALANSAREPKHGYQPYKGIPPLREAMSDWYQRVYGVHINPDDQVIPLMGSKEGIFHISMAFLNPGDKALIPNPGYPSYASAIRLAGAEAVPYRLEADQNWLPDLTDLSRQVDKRTKVLWINYPHMPTGATASMQSLESLVEFALEHRLLLCHDNPYSLVMNDNPLSIMSVAGAWDCTIELNSLSKTFNMAGWRVGMALGDAFFLEQMLRIKTNMDSGMFYAVQQGAIAALAVGEEWYGQLNSVYQERRQLAEQLMHTLGCSFRTNQTGMFVWGKAPEYIADVRHWINEILQTAHVFITPGMIFGSEGQQYVRVSLCSRTQQISEAIRRISQMAIS